MTVGDGQTTQTRGMAKIRSGLLFSVKTLPAVSDGDQPGRTVGGPKQRHETLDPEDASVALGDSAPAGLAEEVAGLSFH